MKTVKIVSAILITTLLSVSAVSANHHGEMKENHMKEKNEMKKEHKEKMGEMKKSNKEEMMEHHKKMMAEKKEKMMKMQVIMKPYFDALPQETKDKLNELKAEKKVQMAEKKEKFEKHMEEVKAMTAEEFSEHRKTMKGKMRTEGSTLGVKDKKEGEKKAKMAHFKKVKEIVGTTTPEAKAFISKCEEFHKEMREERKQVKNTRKEMRTENKENRKELRENYKEKRFEMRIKYRKLVNKKLGDRISKISESRLEKILVRIDSKMKKIEANTKLSDSKKERIIAIIGALKDIINEKLDTFSGDKIVDDLLK